MSCRILPILLLIAATFALGTAPARSSVRIEVDKSSQQMSVSVDGVYARILATLERDGPHEAEQSVRTIMAEGEDHFETFRAMQVWLSAHQESEYLRSAAGTEPPPDDPDHQKVQTIYRAVLEQPIAAIRSEILVAPPTLTGRAWTWLAGSMQPRRRSRSAASWSSLIL